MHTAHHTAQPFKVYSEQVKGTDRMHTAHHTAAFSVYLEQVKGTDYCLALLIENIF